MTVATETYALDDHGRQVIPKDSNAILDYSTDWRQWLTLAGDSIATYSVFAAAGASVVVGTVIQNAGIIIAFISGGTPGKLDPVTYRVVTTGGRTDDRTIYLKILDR